MFALWTLICLLALLSLLLIAALVVIRSVAGFQRDAQLADQHAARRALVAFATSPDELTLLRALKPIRPSIVSDQAQDLVGLVRGELVPRLRNVLFALNIHAFESKRLLSGFLPSRIRAAEFLGHFGDAGNESVLMRALNDRSVEVRIAALISLARHQVQLNLPAVLQVVTSSDAASSRLRTFFEIVALHDADAVYALLDHASIPPSMKALAVLGICRTKAPQLVDRVIEHLTCTQEPMVCAAIVRGSALMQHRRARDLILDNLRAEDVILRQAAAEAAEMLGIADEQILDGLEPLMDEVDWRVRFAASNALAALGEAGQARLRTLPTRPKSTARSRRASQLVLMNFGSRRCPT